MLSLYGWPMKKLDAMKARLAAATLGPWNWQAGDASMIWLHGPDDMRDVVLTCTRCESCQKSEKKCDWPEKADGDFIAHARTDMELLLAVAQASCALNESLSSARELVDWNDSRWAVMVGNLRSTLVALDAEEI